LSLASGTAFSSTLFLTTEQSQSLLDWVVASGKNLIAIYITHGHGDHFFGLAPLLARFPLAKAVAIPGVVRAMETQISPAFVDSFLRKRLDEAATTARQLYDAMLKLYPDRANPGSLWSGANAAKKQA
jgi:glyoxylase-like metal-dependent hydrolase (beta-lactamase superfamily II)